MMEEILTSNKDIKHCLNSCCKTTMTVTFSIFKGSLIRPLLDSPIRWSSVIVSGKQCDRSALQRALFLRAGNLTFYSKHLSTEQVPYSNGPNRSDCLMVRFFNEV